MNYPDHVIDAIANHWTDVHPQGGTSCPSCRSSAEGFLEAITAAGYIVIPDPSITLQKWAQQITGAIESMFKLSADEQAAVDSPPADLTVPAAPGEPVDVVTFDGTVVTRVDFGTATRAAISDLMDDADIPAELVDLDAPTGSDIFQAHTDTLAEAAGRHAEQHGQVWADALHLANALQEAPDTDPDPTPPHGTPRPQ